MKKYLLLISLVVSTVCNAADPAAKTSSVSVSYVIAASKQAVSVSSEDMTFVAATLPLQRPGPANLWLVRVEVIYENNTPTGEITVSILDPLLPIPPQGGTAQKVFAGQFHYESGKRLVVLKADDYSLSVTVTVPDQNKSDTVTK